jgi:hypothetical protein
MLACYGLKNVDSKGNAIYVRYINGSLTFACLFACDHRGDISIDMDLGEKCRNNVVRSTAGTFHCFSSVTTCF